MAGNLMEASASTSPLSASSAPSNFVWKYCRLCALEVKQGVYIFGEEGRRLQLPEKIRKTIATLVLEEDTLPKKICTSCCNSLEAYAQFKDSVVDAQEKLSSIAKSIEKSQEQQQNLLQIRNKQFLKSPKRSRLIQSSLQVSPPSSSHLALPPAPSIISVDPDLGEPAIEYDSDDPPASVESLVDNEEDYHNKAQPHPECRPDTGSETIQGINKEINEQDPQPGPSYSAMCLSKQGAPTSSSSITHGSIHPEPLDASKNNSFSDNSPASTEDENEENSSEGKIENSSYLICGLCTAPLSDKSSVTFHHNSVHSGQAGPTYGCSLCPRICNSYEAIRQHIYRHKMFLEGTLRCADCEKSFATKDHLNFHVTSQHNPLGKKAFSCNICGSKFSSDIALSSHVRKVHSNYPGDSKRSVGLIDDGTTNGNKAETFQASLASAFCKNVSAAASTSPTVKESSLEKLAKSSPIKTRSDQSMNEAPIIVATPKIPESTNADLSKGGGSSSSNIGSINEEGADDTSSMKNNVKQKPDETGHWQCGVCDKILYTKNGYDTHIKTHKGRRFTCEDCGASYTQKVSLEHHIKIHHKNLDKEIECPECMKKFKTIRQLTWHKKVHERPLTNIICPQCDKKFLNLISLKTHMKLHRGSKKFCCEECPKSFFTKLKLEEHINSHTGKRPYGCPADKCSKVFSCYSNYGKHFKKNHKELIGPKGSMVPTPIKIQDNNTTPSTQSSPSGFKRKPEKGDTHPNLEKANISAPKNNFHDTTSETFTVSIEKGMNPSVGPVPIINQGKSSEQSTESQLPTSSPTTSAFQSEPLVHHNSSNSSHHQHTSAIQVPYATNVLSTANTSQSSHSIQVLSQANKTPLNASYSTPQSHTSMGSVHSNPSVAMNSTSSSFTPQVSTSHHSNIPLLINTNHLSNNTVAHGGSQCQVIAIHTSNPSISISDTNNLQLAHSQTPTTSGTHFQSHHQHPVSIGGGGVIAAHTNNAHHSGSSLHTPTHGAQSQSSHHHHHSHSSHPVSQFQLQPHTQSVWQPVMLPSSKTYNNPNTLAGLTTLNSLDLLDCGATIVAAHTSDTLSSGAVGSNHSHITSQHQQNNFNVIHVPATAAHHATTLPLANPSSHVHHHHPSGTSLQSSSNNTGGHQTLHPNSANGGNHHQNQNIHISTPSAHNNNIPLTSTVGTTVNVPNYVPSTHQNEPMKLSQKLESNNFQEMPMELTKVFQRDPLELCVRQEFSAGGTSTGAQPLMDLSSRVVSVSVGGQGNPSINTATSIAMSLNANNNNSSNNNHPSHFGNTGPNNGSGGGGGIPASASTVLSVPYHKPDLVERELTLNDFTGAFRQPIDLIARSDEHSHELCTEGNLVDLSLRSSFGQDQSASSFLRELIDLSSRSDSFHGEINLTNKHQSPPSSSVSNPQLHHHITHSSTGQLISAAKPTNSNPPNSHHNNPGHHHHHHHHIQASTHQHHQSSNNNNGGSNSGIGLQTVIYSDTIFGLQN